MHFDSSHTNRASIQTLQNAGLSQSNPSKALFTKSIDPRQDSNSKTRRRLFPTPSPNSSHVGTLTDNPPGDEEEIQDFTPRGLDDSTPAQAEQIEPHRQSRARKGKQALAQSRSTKTALQPTSKMKADRTQGETPPATAAHSHDIEQANPTAQPPAKTPQISQPEQEVAHQPTPPRASSLSVQPQPPVLPRKLTTSTSKQANKNDKNKDDNSNNPPPSITRAVRSSERVSRARSIIDLCATY